jgi:4-diphosphocytidyl-2-C-methyl-D-erythritol kinase
MGSSTPTKAPTKTHTTMDTLRWLAPAKLNLFLHITGQRPDGYHELQTVFQLLDYYDELGFNLRDDGLIARSGELYGITDNDELCCRSARLLQSHFVTKKGGKKKGVTISINKRIPMGGGLGGGSSDAATTLIALNHLWGLGLTRNELAEIGLGLGADIPVFVHGESAWAEGIGEKLTPIELPEQWFLILTPKVHVSTKAVFSHKCLTLGSTAITIRDFRAGLAENQLETVVREVYPEVAKALKVLENYGVARMTGTGASVFLACDDEQAARQVLAKCPPEMPGFIAKGIQEHPLRSYPSLAV